MEVTWVLDPEILTPEDWSQMPEEIRRAVARIADDNEPILSAFQSATL